MPSQLHQYTMRAEVDLMIDDLHATLEVLRARAAQAPTDDLLAASLRLMFASRQVNEAIGELSPIDPPRIDPRT